MTDIDETLGQIRRRDAMYPTQELTAGPVEDRRTLLTIIDQLQEEIRQLRGNGFIRDDEVWFECRTCGLSVQDSTRSWQHEQDTGHQMIEMWSGVS